MKTYLNPKQARLKSSSVVYIVKDKKDYWLGVYSDRLEFAPTGYGRDYSTCIRHKITKEAYDALYQVAKANRNKTAP